MSSNNASFYDNMAGDGAAASKRLGGSGSTSLVNTGVPHLQRVEEEGSRCIPAPTQPVKSVCWAKVREERANRE